MYLSVLRRSFWSLPQVLSGWLGLEFNFTQKKKQQQKTKKLFTGWAIKTIYKKFDGGAKTHASDPKI